MGFVNTPWKVERTPGCVDVVDSQGYALVSIDLTEGDFLSGTVEQELEKAYLLAAAPEIHSAATDFMECLADTERASNEDLVMKLCDRLHAALQLAAVKDAPPPEPPSEKPPVKENPNQFRSNSSLKAAGR